MGTCESGHIVEAGSTTCSACGAEVGEEIWSGRAVVTGGPGPAVTGEQPGAAPPPSARSAVPGAAGGAIPSGAIPGGAIPGGAIPSGAIPSGAIPGGAIPGAAGPLWGAGSSGGTGGPDGTARRRRPTVIGVVGGVATVVVVVVVVLGLTLSSSSGPPKTVAAQPGPNVTPQQVVDQLIADDFAGKLQAVCTLVPPSQRSACRSDIAAAPFTVSATGAAHATDVYFHGRRALVAVVGRICVRVTGPTSTALEGAGESRQCESNNRRDGGLPHDAGAFAADYAQAVSGNGNTLSPAPVTEVGGVWYVDLGLPSGSGSGTGISGPADDRAAQSNLTNALTEASALYQAGNQSFTGMVTSEFNASAPEFAWQTSACGSAPSNCISYHVMDADTRGDAQVLLMADRSNADRTCWYIAELEETPSTASITGSGATGLDLTQAGVYYAKWSGRSVCSASDPVVHHFNTWADTYSSVARNR